MIVRFIQNGTVQLYSPTEKVFGSTPDTYTYQAVSQSQRIVLWLGLGKLWTGLHVVNVVRRATVSFLLAVLTELVMSS